MLLLIIIAMFVASFVHVTYNGYLWGGYDDHNPYLLPKWGKSTTPPLDIAHRFIGYAGDTYLQWSKWRLKTRYVVIDAAISIASGLAVILAGWKLIL